jgi:hypothetical protein
MSCSIFSAKAQIEAEPRERKIGRANTFQIGAPRSARARLYLYFTRAELKVLASLASTASGLARSLGAGRGRRDGDEGVHAERCLSGGGENVAGRQAGCQAECQAATRPSRIGGGPSRPGLGSSARRQHSPF